MSEDHMNTSSEFGSSPSESNFSPPYPDDINNLIETLMSTSPPEPSLPPPYARGLDILLVDPDTASLMTIASMLERYTYRVVATESARIALCFIRSEMQDRTFDLVIANADLEGTNILDFTCSVLSEGLPIVFMTSNAEEVELVKKATSEGASSVHYEKPIALDDLKDVWRRIFEPRTKPSFTHGDQQAKAADESDNSHDRKGKRKVFEEVNADKELKKNRANENDESGHHDRNGKGEMRSNVDDEEPREAKPNGGVGEKDIHLQINPDENENENEKCLLEKKPRMVWTRDLHMKFLNAITILGDAKSRPKAIIEIMKVPGLCQNQVASHLQKYKNQIRRSEENIFATLPIYLNEQIEGKSTGDQMQLLKNQLSTFSMENNTREIPTLDKTLSYKEKLELVSSYINQQCKPQELLPIKGLDAWGDFMITPTSYDNKAANSPNENFTNSQAMNPDLESNQSANLLTDSCFDCDYIFKIVEDEEKNTDNGTKAFESQANLIGLDGHSDMMGSAKDQCN